VSGNHGDSQDSQKCLPFLHRTIGGSLPIQTSDVSPSVIVRRVRAQTRNTLTITYVTVRVKLFCEPAPFALWLNGAEKPRLTSWWQQVA
jgi:hypothetical protein